MYPKVSIITVNYNQAAVTEELLTSLSSITYPNYEVWVVDNGSQQNCANLLQKFPHIHLIIHPENLGFAGGNNLALARASGSYLLLLNNDTEVTPGFLEPMVDACEQQPAIGVMSPRILFHNSGNLVQYAGTSAINPLTCRGFTRGYLDQDNEQYNILQQTSLAHGACMLIRKSLVEQIGTLPEDYFLYYEEYDFCEQAKRAGFEIWYNGFSVIYHKESVSVGKLSPLKSFYMARNRILFARRNFSLINRLTAIAFFLLAAVPKTIMTEAMKGRWKNVRAFLKGVASGLRPQISSGRFPL